MDLKVHINAYGKNSNDVMKDSHIWEVIDKLENQEEYEQLKKLLVLYLSTLLKMDWERSKEEVRGNKYQIVLYLTVLCSVISILYGYFVRLKSSLDILGLFLILIEVYPVIMPRRMGMNHDKALEWFSKDKNTFVNQFVKTMCICILCFGGLTLVVCYLNNMKNFELVFDWSFYLLIVSFLVRFLQEYQKYSLEVYYYENILRCKQNVYIGQRQ